MGRATEQNTAHQKTLLCYKAVSRYTTESYNAVRL